MGKKNKKKFNHLPDPETYTYSEFKSINGSVTRKYIYNKGSRSDAFGRTTTFYLVSPRFLTFLLTLTV